MTEAVEQLKSQVSVLSAAERADLAYFLLSSLGPEEEGVEDAWRKEISRRVTEIRNGQAIGRPLDEVLAEIWDSMVAEAENLPMTEAQRQDLQRRLAAYEANRHAGSTWEEVKARLQELRMNLPLIITPEAEEDLAEAKAWYNQQRAD